MRKSTLGLYLLLVVGLLLGVASLGITWAASDENSTLAQRFAESGSTLSVADDGTSAVWTAHFDAAVILDDKVLLQVKQHKTTLTYTSGDQVLPVTNWSDVAAWQTIGIAQPTDGVATFKVARPLVLAHEYRAVVNPGPGELITGTVTYAAPRHRVDDGLPTIYVDTEDGSRIDSPNAAWEGKVTIDGAGGGPCASTQPMLGTVRAHSPAALDMDKVGLDVDLAAETGLCGMPPGTTWALLAAHYDRSLLRSGIAMYLGQHLDGLAWTPHTVPVDVYVNGEYRGLFDLTERVEIGPARIAIPDLANATTTPPTDWNSSPTITGGYLLKWAPDALGDNDIETPTRGTIAILEPGTEVDQSDITDAQLAYIRSYVLAADAAFDSAALADPDTGWRTYVDEKSAVDFYLAQEYLRKAGVNTAMSAYLYKARDTAAGPGKLYFGPLSEVDESMGDVAYPGDTDQPRGWYLGVGVTPAATTRQNGTTRPAVSGEVPVAEADTWLTKLSSDPTFLSAVQARWQELHPVFAGLPGFIDQRAAVISRGALANFETWSISEPLGTGHRVQGSWDSEVWAVKDWTTQRTDWLNGQWG